MCDKLYVCHHLFLDADEIAEPKSRSIRSFSIIEKIKEFFNWNETEFDAIPNERAPRVNWRKDRWGPYIGKKDTDPNKLRTPGTGNYDYEDYYFDYYENRNQYRQKPLFKQEPPLPKYPPGYWNKYWYGFISRTISNQTHNPTIPFV